MTTRINTFIFLLSLIASAGFSQTTGKTFSKSFNADLQSSIRLDLPGAVDLKVWDNPVVRIEFTVSSPSVNGSVLNELATVGRYNLVSATEGNKLIIKMPNTQRTVKIKGEELKENFTFTVFVPKNRDIEMPNQQALAEVKK